MTYRAHGRDRERDTLRNPRQQTRFESDDVALQILTSYRFSTTMITVPFLKEQSPEIGLLDAVAYLEEILRMWASDGIKTVTIANSMHAIVESVDSK